MRSASRFCPLPREDVDVDEHHDGRASDLDMFASALGCGVVSISLLATLRAFPVLFFSFDIVNVYWGWILHGARRDYGNNGRDSVYIIFLEFAYWRNQT